MLIIWYILSTEQSVLRLLLYSTSSVKTTAGSYPLHKQHHTDTSTSVEGNFVSAQSGWGMKSITQLRLATHAFAARTVINLP